VNHVTTPRCGRGLDGRSHSKIRTLPRPRRRLRITTQNNDPHEEHDFGSFEHAGKTIFWKIDCYDRDLNYGSPDPADPIVTARILTVMLAEEY
jgi:hypothetical protein